MTNLNNMSVEELLELTNESEGIESVETYAHGTLIKEENTEGCLLIF